MDREGPPLRAGLTGGIASGKSTVAGFLADLGALVLDADAIARELMTPGGAAHDQVVSRFGPGILDPRGRIDRAALGAIVFHDRRSREALDAIVHPKVTAEIERRLARPGVEHEPPIAVIDAALLVESGFHRRMHRLIVVRCSVETQVARLTERGRLDAGEARARIESQAPLEEKISLADYVIDTEVPLEETRRRCAQVYASLLDDFSKTFGRHPA